MQRQQQHQLQAVEVAEAAAASCTDVPALMRPVGTAGGAVAFRA